MPLLTNSVLLYTIISFVVLVVNSCFTVLTVVNRMNITSSQVQLVRQLGTLGYSQRRISRLASMSRDTVRRILTGQRRERDVPMIVAPNARRPARRCPHCGGLVFMPCVACSVRQIVREARRRRGPSSATVAGR